MKKAKVQLISFKKIIIIIIIISFLELVVAMLANFLWTFLHSKMNLLYFSEVLWRKITKAYIVDIRLFRIFWLQLYIHRCQHQYQPHLNTMAMVIIYYRRIIRWMLPVVFTTYFNENMSFIFFQKIGNSWLFTSYCLFFF